MKLLEFNEHLSLFEADSDGRCTAIATFDLDDVDAAYEELQARWQSNELAEHPVAAAWLRDFGAAHRRHEWDALVACYAEEFLGVDHRLVGWGTLRGRTAFLPTLRTVVELAPDARLRGDHARAASRGLLAASTWVGTRDDGAFESSFIVVTEVDARGKAVRQDFYDSHHVDAACARFAEIRAGATCAPFRAAR
jgi:hypothetical protein